MNAILGKVLFLPFQNHLLEIGIKTTKLKLMATVLKLTDVHKRFGQREAVNGLNLEVHSGEVFGFLGPNGAGKSTTIRMLVNLIKPDSGTIELFGKDLRVTGNRVLEKVGVLVEEPDFYNYLSARKNLEILSKLSGRCDRAHLDFLLELVGLSDRADDRVKKYSHGMRQRLGLAQALLNDPELIILDEPTSGLDPEGMKEIRELIIRLSEEKKCTIFLSTHLLHEVEQVCSHLAIINKGKLIVQGNVEELLLASNEINMELEVDNPETARLHLSTQNWVKLLEENEKSIKVRVKKELRSQLISFLIQHGVQIHSAVTRKSLEEFYLSLTSGEE